MIKISFKQECLQGKRGSLNIDKTVQGAVGKKCLPFFVSCSFCRGRTTTLVMSVNILGLCRAIFYHTSATGDAQSLAFAANLVFNGKNLIF